MYILEADGNPAGQVRFDIDAVGRAEVDISIAPEYRGHGYGAEALRLASARLFVDTGSAEVVAHIKPDNLASVRTFERAGFAADVEGHGGRSEIIRMTLTRRGVR
jgi:RimJ/RimL family protein N-acetyltransferase